MYKLLRISECSSKTPRSRAPSRPSRLALDQAALAAASQSALSPGDASTLAKKLNSDFTFIVTGAHGGLRSISDPSKWHVLRRVAWWGLRVDPSCILDVRPTMHPLA